MSDRKNLQGTWTITGLEMDGRKAAFGGGKIVITGGRFTTVGMGDGFAGTVAFDESKNPRQFDLTFTQGTHKGKKSMGIYELDGDAWTICMGLAGNRRRPKEFTTMPGDGFALEVLQRGDAVVQSAIEEPEEDPGPATELDGEWSMVSGSMDGHPMDPRLVKTGRRVSKGNRLTVLFGGQPYMKASIALNPAKRSIDYALNTGGTQQGIYKLEGTALELCMAAAGRERPSDFKPGLGRTITVWKRIGR